MVDKHGRGCLQLARQGCQGDKQVLANWLMQNVPGIQDTYGKGRAGKDKKRGQWSSGYRQDEKVKQGYQPQTGANGGGKGGEWRGYGEWRWL